jgi:hypothetical protein
LKEISRNAAVAGIFNVMASSEKSRRLHQGLRGLPDDALDMMAGLSGVPAHHFHIHRAMVRGEENVFMEELGRVDGLLQTGDIILMTGKGLSSQALAGLQKATYIRARSSHVALIHADFVCIDAMPKIGASNRIISEVLSNAENDWRVIRCKALQSKSRDTIARACVFFLAQPYKILPSKSSAKTYSYCSELARKIYSESKIGGVAIPDNVIIKPADFDRLADGHPQWADVTELVRPAVDFCAKYPELVKISAKLFIDGLKLNRKRFEERTVQLGEIRAAAKAGKISRDQAMEFTRRIKDIENNLNHTFWDVSRK